jgi:hypothetical protein
MQAVMSASGKRFIIDKQSDPLDFLSWLINSLHTDLAAGKRKRRSGEMAAACLLLLCYLLKESLLLPPYLCPADALLSCSHCSLPACLSDASCMPASLCALQSSPTVFKASWRL